MARPYWSGQIQISLVSFGVSLYVATEAKANISFHEISRSTGERVRHQKVLDSAAESNSVQPEDVVEKDEIVKGYEYSKGKYVTLEPSEIENLRVPSKHVIAVSQFIDRMELKPEYIEKPYFVVPENTSQGEAFATVRKGLLNTGKIAIGKISFSGREHIVAISPFDTEGGGMLAFTLHFENELRSQQTYFRNIPKETINADSLAMAEGLIEKWSTKFDLGKFEDGYEAAVKELVEAKLKHLPVPRDEGPRAQTGKVVNLFDALRKSLDSDRKAKPGAGAAKKRAIRKEPAARKGIRLVKTPKRKTA